MARMFLPESNTLRRSFLSLARTSERKKTQGTRSRSSTVIRNLDEAVESSDEQPVTSSAEEAISGGWRRHTDESLGTFLHQHESVLFQVSFVICKILP